MEFVRGIVNLKSAHYGCVSSIGAFDGVHKGHQLVLKQLREQSEKRGVPSTVLTLEPLPREFLNPATAPPRLMSLREKCEAIAELGIDRLLCVRFNTRIREIPAEKFIREVFVQRLGIQHMVAGEDIRFGHEQQGDLQLLRRLGEEYNFSVERASMLQMEGGRVSSTRIRQALQDSDFALAEKLLGRPYTIAGRVIAGRRLGTKVTGYPTANLDLCRHRSVLSGVYFVLVFRAAEDALPGVANVGIRPTIGEQTEALLEVHIPGFRGDLYGERICVQFLHKLREEQRFASLTELRTQIGEDVSAAQDWFRHRRAAL